MCVICREIIPIQPHMNVCVGYKKEKMMRLHPQILVFNESTVLTDTDVSAALPAFKHACDYWFEPAWNATAGFLFVPKGTTKPTGPNLWELHFLDTSDQAGALGYHLDEKGMPVM